VTERTSERHGVVPGRRRPSPWWWLVLAVLVAVLIGLVVWGGAGDDEPAATPREFVTVGGEPLLGRPDPDLTPFIGEEVLGANIPVEGVIAEGVFWAGAGRELVLVVEPEDDTTPVAPGDRVSIRGRIAELDDDIRVIAIGEHEERLDRQGAYVAADDVAHVAR
jgi:hypothetical protein